MNCLVLGAAGFIGQHLCRALCSHGHIVRGFDLFPSKEGAWHEIEGVNWVAGNFASVQDIARALRNIDIVFHLISTTIPKTSNLDPAADLGKNVAGTLQLLDQMICLPQVPRLIFLSSGGTVYGVPQSLPIKEEHPTEPLCAYGVGKLAIEKYLALYHHLHGLNYRILRLANPYGECQDGQRGQGVIPAFLTRALNNEPLQVWGDGLVVRDYFHIEDLCSALLLTLEYTGSQRIFNIGSGKGESLNSLIEKIRGLVQKDVVCEYLFARDCDVPVNVLDIQRARKELGWSPAISLNEGLFRTLEWLRRRQ